jgi:hypothetical protein
LYTLFIPDLFASSSFTIVANVVAVCMILSIPLARSVREFKTSKRQTVGCSNAKYEQEKML